MNRKDYQKLMDSIEPDSRLQTSIYQNINNKSSKKSLYPQLALACLTVFVAFSVIHTKPERTVKNPFVIEVQAKDGIEKVNADAKKTFIIQNKTSYQEDQETNPFSIAGHRGTYYDGEKEKSYEFRQLLLSLPIEIKGEHIRSISYEIQGPHANLIPVYSLEKYVVGNVDEIDMALKKYYYHTNPEKYKHREWKMYSEMSEEGQKVFQKYVDIYKDDLVNDDWWKLMGNTEEDFYNDKNTWRILWKIKCSGAEYANHKNMTEDEKDRFLRQQIIDLTRYFTWGSEDFTTAVMYDYQRIQEDDIHFQLSIFHDNYKIPNSEFLSALEKTNIQIKVYYDDATMSQKTISFQDINEDTGTYTLIIE